MDKEQLRFVSVEFTRFKAFKKFTLKLKAFNVLVGPNNAGKSTVLAAFRILAASLRRANSRRPTPVGGNLGFGYPVDLASVSVADENIFYNYNEEDGAEVVFTLSNNNLLRLKFPAGGGCFLLAETGTGRPTTPTKFKSSFNCSIGFVPILGPVDHHEPLYEAQAARLALFNYRAARNFRNIWYHFPEQFNKFREILKETWPGMDVEPPEVNKSHNPAQLNMFCPEGRIPREIFWSGFGFQVWCQMLTHLIQSSNASIFLIDEPDIYLHSELQRQLLGLLHNLGPDILIATHSTEIITEAETDEIVLINKNKRSANRLKSPSQLSDVFTVLGSNTNLVLTQLAKTRKALFVEGKDFQILGKFARKLQKMKVANRVDFAVVPIGGFSPDRIRSLKKGMETTLGSTIGTAAILDRDYRSNEQCEAIAKDCEAFCDFVRILNRKEIENFLLVPSAINRAVKRKISDQEKKSGKAIPYDNSAPIILENLINASKTQFMAQYLDQNRHFTRTTNSKTSSATRDKVALEHIDSVWSDHASRLKVVPGKEIFSTLNQELQGRFSINITATSVINSMKNEEISDEMRCLVDSLVQFSNSIGVKGG